MTEAVIVDVDGTLCDVSSVLHHITTPGQTKNFAAFHSEAAHCPPNERVIQWCREHVEQGRELVIVTGRKYQWEEETYKWLQKNLPFPFSGPFMRGDKDGRPDSQVKRDIHRVLTEKHGFNIVAAIDDRPSIIATWRSMGIPTTAVYRPDWEAAGEHYEPGDQP